MKGKLIKTDVNYILEDDKGVVIASTSLKRVEGLSLSIKNCQAIERGYDLDELADKHYDIHIKRGHTKEDSLQRKIDFILGFQKALELMGDNVFNWLEKKGYLSDDKDIIKKEYNHQTEWDVEIKMDDVWDGLDSTRIFPKEETSFPKLDENNCLILKRN